MAALGIFGTVTAQILGVGAAAPRFRLDAADVASAWGRRGGRGQAAICAADEDTLTLAAHAAGAALRAAGIDPAAVDGLWWGTTRPPFAEGPSHGILASACALPRHSGGALNSGSPHAGIDALLGAINAVAAGAAGVALVVASDAALPGLGSGFEARCGAGAVAFVLGRDSGPARFGLHVTRAIPALDRYRGDGENATRDLYDARLFREEVFVPLVLDVAEHLRALEPRAWSLPDPDGRLGGVIAKRLGATNAAGAVYDELGDTGAAAPLLGIAGALDASGVVAIVGYGGGRATGIEVVLDGPVPGAVTTTQVLANGTALSYAGALRSRGQLRAAGETVPMGVPPESAMFLRGADEVLQLLGARCVECGTVNTPPSIHPHCIACGATKFEVVSLARVGTVHTFVVNQTMPAPFEAPLPIAVIDLEDGARVMLQVVGDGADLEVGSSVELVLRRYAHERGVPVYGYKALVVTP